MANVKFVYITASSPDEAREIGRALVQARLAACVNIFENMNSIYWWEGEVQEGREAVLIAKTTGLLVSALIQEVKRLHSYENPCVVTLPVESGSPAFLDWIHKETSRP
ncbi:MAG: divalent-cation tolerance protein CutA [Proteobacteria bacterium]|nr:divalent-cation tolerance protein CutA [Pseudomonadota bacterium]MBU4470539.1 divalent-cation tolerance protein CutA [Pseudomonadota bacterium]MCG2751375.1 divalent-cation tolerance protein CutA [Desulfobacteraceae bacterium]